MRRKNFNPTHLQARVIRTLANRGQATVTDWTAWYPMTEEQVRGVIRSLSYRAIVDAVGFDGRARIYGLTNAGWDAAEKLDPEDEE